MRKLIFILIFLIIGASCSSDDAEEPLITVDVKEGILGIWYVEWECNNRIHNWEFFNDGSFEINFMDTNNSGNYSITGKNLTIRDFNDIGTGNERYEIIVLTSDRLELDDFGDFGINYQFVRACP
ncbi:lipocalin family protein [Christiangramia forsetii]|uniref:Secreted protein n=1 Tax=Christiangramia forsetii (strain DSM 17595 / CGMCC 1.15422 / KT0803) TaxID=411154 RepID=A0M3K0_CHRFK|nr:lipocalin family protein [Christiangramia forsetii]CAL67195.1 secreted protein [Christiangramia forsetii KT0803]